MRCALGVFLLIGLSTGACSPSTITAAAQTGAADVDRAPTAQPQPREGLAMSEFSVSMRRGACFGRCPQYTVAVDGDGGVTFNGDRFVNASGAHSGNADMAAVARLRDKTNEVFSTLDDVVPGAASCKHYATDHPQITLQLHTADAVRTLRHYTGCASAPAKLVELENLIDQTANVDQWVSARALK